MWVLGPCRPQGPMGSSGKAPCVWARCTYNIKTGADPGRGKIGVRSPNPLPGSNSCKISPFLGTLPFAPGHLAFNAAPPPFQNPGFATDIMMWRSGEVWARSTCNIILCLIHNHFWNNREYQIWHTNTANYILQMKGDGGRTCSSLCKLSYR